MSEATNFGTDQVLAYNVKPWVQLGFAVPNFGKNLTTLNNTIFNLADEIGRVQVFMMTHVDVTRTAYPSRNTVQRLGMILNRIQTVLVGRAKDANAVRLEPDHASPAPQHWSIHPTPFFKGPILNNHWLKEYNHMTMIALANMYQHEDNNLSLTLTREAAGDFWKYFREVRNMIASELLMLPSTEYDRDDFKFTDAHYEAYAPQGQIVRLASVTGPGNIDERFTEEDISPFLRGIPSNLILPNLAKYPVAGMQDWDGVKSNDQTIDDEVQGTGDGSALEEIL